MSKRFKTRWIWKALIWKILSAVTGAAVVLHLTGRYQTSWDYLALYVPITLALFVLHEWAWQSAKVRRRNKCAACRDRHQASLFCPKCGREL